MVINGLINIKSNCSNSNMMLFISLCTLVVGRTVFGICTFAKNNDFINFGPTIFRKCQGQIEAMGHRIATNMKTDR